MVGHGEVAGPFAGGEVVDDGEGQLKSTEKAVALFFTGRCTVFGKRIMTTNREYQVTTDRGRMDMRLLHDFLRSSYWATNIPRAVLESSIENSLCFGVFYGEKQVGFARVITDYATMAYLADVFIVPAHRGRGLSKRLVRSVLEHPKLQGLRRVLLATRDAHGLYAQFGFQPLANPEDFMSLHKAQVYEG